MIVTIHNKGIIKNTIVIKITKGLKMASEAHFVQLKKIKTHHQIKSIWVSYQRHGGPKAPNPYSTHTE
jgi:hypothetical protein